MTDDELRNLVGSLAIAQKKTDAQLAKTDAQLAKTDAKLGKIAEMYGGVSNNQGDIAEEFFFNSLKEKLLLKGISFESIERNASRCTRDGADEFDILMINGSDVFIIEVKYKAHERDLDKLVEKKALSFKKLFPAYRNYTHHLGLASFHVNESLKKEALRRGVTVLQRKGDLIVTTTAD